MPAATNPSSANLLNRINPALFRVRIDQLAPTACSSAGHAGKLKTLALFCSAHAPLRMIGAMIISPARNKTGRRRLLHRILILNRQASMAGQQLEFTMSYTAKSKAALHDVKETVEDGAADAAQRVSDAVDSLSREAGHVRNAVSRSAQDIANEVTKKLRAAGVDTDQLIITAKEQATDVQQKLTDEIRARPLRALGIAALIGVAFGLLSTR